MQGINYLTDQQGRRVAVQIDLAKYGEIWEDFFDVLTAQNRENDPREDFASVTVKLRRKDKLNV